MGWERLSRSGRRCSGMSAISKSLKTKFRETCVRVESKFPSLVTQLTSEQPAEGAALVLSGVGSSGCHPRRLRRAVAPCCGRAAAPLDSSRGRPTSCRCYFCVSPCPFFHVKCNFLLSALLYAFFFFLQLVCVGTAPLNQGVRAASATLS